MSIRSFGRTLGLGAVVLSAILLIVALVGGMTGRTHARTELPHAASTIPHAQSPASDPAGHPGPR